MAKSIVGVNVASITSEYQHKLDMLNGLLLIEMDEVKEVGLIALPREMENRIYTGKVISASPKAIKMFHEEYPGEQLVGRTITVMEYKPLQEIKINGKVYRVMKQEDMVGLIPNATVN